MISSLQQHYFDDRYALKDSEGRQVEQKVPQMWARVASAIGDSDIEREAFYSILRGFRFVPGGRILAGAGAESEKTFYNCFVIPPEARHPIDHYPLDYPGDDSRESIFDTIKTMVDIMSRGGGVGINWSVLRPSGAYLKRISGTSSGPVGWMDVASKAVGEVIQGGSRRGAAMFMLDDWHPDVLSFIEAKRDNSKITNANVSVAVSDEFMEAVRDGKDWNLVFPLTDVPDYNRAWHGDISSWKAEGRPVRVYRTIEARVLWEAIASSAHASGEPGIVFLGRYNEQSTANGFERIISVNPCGEQGLGAYSVCNLGAMNLDAYVKGVGIFDWNSFKRDVGVAIRFLDCVIDKNFYFLPQTANQQRNLRRIGLGVMGLADALVRMSMRYGDEASVRFTTEVFKAMKDEAIYTSYLLARQKGPAPAYRDFMWERPYLEEYSRRHAFSSHHYADAVGQPLRNIFLLTQAPTGTTSLLAGVNSGIEPYFNLKTWREDRTGGRYVYAKALEDIGVDLELPDFVVTASDITVEEHIAIQAAAQRYIDSSVSKTINAPSEQTVEEVQKAFMMAYDSGLKGIAYYRDGSRNVQVLYQRAPNEVIAELEAKVKELSAKLAFRDRVDKVWEGVVSYGGQTFGQDVCPSCNKGAIVYEEGCQRCAGAEGHEPCGWSAC